MRDRLGWALERERAGSVSYQRFERGDLLLVWRESVVWELTPGGLAHHAPRSS